MDNLQNATTVLSIGQISLWVTFKLAKLYRGQIQVLITIKLAPLYREQISVWVTFKLAPLYREQISRIGNLQTATTVSGTNTSVPRQAKTSLNSVRDVPMKWRYKQRRFF